MESPGRGASRGSDRAVNIARRDLAQIVPLRAAKCYVGLSWDQQHESKYDSTVALSPADVSSKCCVRSQAQEFAQRTGWSFRDGVRALVHAVGPDANAKGQLSDQSRTLRCRHRSRSRNPLLINSPPLSSKRVNRPGGVMNELGDSGALCVETGGCNMARCRRQHDRR